jgi:hypothetical protein
MGMMLTTHDATNAMLKHRVAKDRSLSYHGVMQKLV